MAECHLMFLVTIPIYDGSMKVRGHPRKRDLAKDILNNDLSANFARKLVAQL